MQHAAQTSNCQRVQVDPHWRTWPICTASRSLGLAGVLGPSASGLRRSRPDHAAASGAPDRSAGKRKTGRFPGIQLPICFPIGLLAPSVQQICLRPSVAIAGVIAGKAGGTGILSRSSQLARPGAEPKPLVVGTTPTAPPYGPAARALGGAQIGPRVTGARARAGAERSSTGKAAGTGNLSRSSQLARLGM